ncbi:MAG TPA: GxGYxYP domain-containing protein [Bacteroidota bacterium]|nr:GxGYxYP domain-containing protein [Bacteroidota bacterium]
MNMYRRIAISLLCCCAFLAWRATAQESLSLLGTWDLLPGQSTDIDHFGALTIDVRQSPQGLTIGETWGRGRTFRDSLTLEPGGPPAEVTVRTWVFPSNIFMGLRMPEGSLRRVSAAWEGKNRLRVDERFSIHGSQGTVPVNAVHRFEVTDRDEILIYTAERSSRKTGPPMKYVLKRRGARQAFTFRLADDWTVGGKLAQNAMMISLQGLANREGPALYLLYPDDWPFTYVNSVLDFYKEKRYYTFRELKTPAEALQALGKSARGYVVWDTDVRTSLVVAFTAAGLEDAIVVSGEEIALAEKAGLRKLEDFRGTFTGMNDAKIYAWALERYWGRCSRETIVWLGGEHGNVMKPAVADWGMYRRVFFSDLSCRPSDSAEYALSRRLLAEMKPMSMVMGWHSYAKDLEEEFVTLTSSFGHRVEGLNTLPNLSFSSQIPASPGFVFRNNHHITPGVRVAPGPKVYVSCIQTDGIGLGAWLKPGRGEIPYAWEVLMNYTWMAPGMAEYFYSMATPNDYFIGCLSGPGYLYPKAVPPSMLPPLIATAREQMKALDLRVFEIMDWSRGSEFEGNTDLPEDIIGKYFGGMPEAIGFVNGYGPGYTFTAKDGRAFVSYDYYLSPVRPESDAVADLQELAAINAKRPYFLLVHVREWSDVRRVKGILDRLGPEFEVVPLDVFLAMAGESPTFEERVLPR